ncbi:MAG: glycoside hydrolase family 15 protein, partial [Myxococcales bacterium]|nr:glycoside hydrolase family 15 protein [Myxococcales bacterium]
HNDNLEIMYTVDGQPVPDERVLHGWAGHKGSAPVRIGNGARDQVQLDTAGALLDAAYLYEQGASGALTFRVWRLLRRVVQSVQRRWSEPDHGIWEPRHGMRHNVHSKLMSWLALDRGARLAPRFGDLSSAHLWASTAAQVREDMCEKGLDPSKNHFVASYGTDHADAALLLVPIHGMLGPNDPRVTKTVDFVRDRLSSGPYIYRYKVDDGVGGEEGAFILCGFWLAEALAMAGRLDEAHDVFSAHVAASNHVGLLAEEIDPSTGGLLGNFPQAFSHLGLIKAAVRIDKGLRMRDEAPAGAARPLRPL